MDLDEALELLKGGEDGVREWNRRRDEGEEIPSLRETDLHDADLRHANLRNAHLQRADLSGAKLRGGDLFNASLSDANLSKAKPPPLPLPTQNLGS